MCNLVSFFVSIRHNKLICGYPYSHSNAPVHSALDDWREAEWTKNGLFILRTTTDDDLNVYKATVLALCKTRTALCEYLSPSIDDEGNTYYFNEYGIHRAGDQPAIICANGSVEFWENDKRHRAGDQPAIIHADGAKEYWLNGKRHRVGNQPAIVGGTGGLEYWVNDKLHRAGGLPAVIQADGTLLYLVNGELHRAGGLPAIIRADCTIEFWENGEFIK